MREFKRVARPKLVSRADLQSYLEENEHRYNGVEALRELR